jgi:hypothetical protein
VRKIQKLTPKVSKPLLDPVLGVVYITIDVHAPFSTKQHPKTGSSKDFETLGVRFLDFSHQIIIIVYFFNLRKKIFEIRMGHGPPLMKTGLRRDHRSLKNLVSF